MADVIEAAEGGYIALNDDSIGHLKDALYKQLIEIANSIKAPEELQLHRDWQKIRCKPDEASDNASSPL